MNKYVIRHSTGSYFVKVNDMQGWSENLSKNSPSFESLEELENFVKTEGLSDLASIGNLTYSIIKGE